MYIWFAYVWQWDIPVLWSAILPARRCEAQIWGSRRGAWGWSYGNYPLQCHLWRRQGCGSSLCCQTAACWYCEVQEGCGAGLLFPGLYLVLLNIVFRWKQSHQSLLTFLLLMGIDAEWLIRALSVGGRKTFFWTHFMSSRCGCFERSVTQKVRLKAAALHYLIQRVVRMDWDYYPTHSQPLFVGPVMIKGEFLVVLIPE